MSTKAKHDFDTDRLTAMRRLVNQIVLDKRGLWNYNTVQVGR